MDRLMQLVEDLKGAVAMLVDAVDNVFAALAEFARLCAHWSRVEYIADGYPYGDHEDGYSMWLRFGCQLN